MGSIEKRPHIRDNKEILTLVGLLHFNGPNRGPTLHANGEQKEAGGEEEEERETEYKSQAEEKMVFDTSSIDEHIIEYLPPALHKGNIATKRQLISIIYSKQII